MNKLKIKAIIKEIKEKYKIGFTDYVEEERGGKITFIRYTLIFKVDDFEIGKGV